MQKYIFRRRRAISNVVAAALLIGIVVVAVALIWFLIAPMFTPKVGLTLVSVSLDNRDGDAYYDVIEIVLRNTGTVALELNTTTGISDSGIDLRVGTTYASNISGITIQGNQPVMSPNTDMRCTIFIPTDYDDDFGLASGVTLTIIVSIKGVGDYTFTYTAP